MPRGSPPRRLGIGSPQAGDELDGTWPREQLEAMDARFVERLTRAIASGLEHRPATITEKTK